MALRKSKIKRTVSWLCRNFISPTPPNPPALYSPPHKELLKYLLEQDAPKKRQNPQMVKRKLEDIQIFNVTITLTQVVPYV